LEIPEPTPRTLQLKISPSVFSSTPHSAQLTVGSVDSTASSPEFQPGKESHNETQASDDNYDNKINGQSQTSIEENFVNDDLELQDDHNIRKRSLEIGDMGDEYSEFDEYFKRQRFL